MFELAYSKKYCLYQYSEQKNNHWGFLVVLSYNGD